MKLPFSHFYVKQDISNAVSTAWDFDIQLAENRSVKFFALLILNKGPVDNQKILEQISQRIMDTIRYQQHILEGNLVSVTNEDFFEQCLQKINSEISIFLSELSVSLPVHSWAMLVGMLAPEPNSRRMQFFTSRFGEVTGWLLNNAQLETKKLINVFDAPDTLPANAMPQKFFRNILSSSIPKNDQLFFCTPNLLNYLSLSEMKNVLGTLSVASALKHFENQINFRPNDYLVSAMTIKLSPHPVVEQKTAPKTRAEAQLSINNLLDTQAKTEKLLGPSVGSGFKSIYKGLTHSAKDFAGRISADNSEIVPSQSVPRQSGARAILSAALLFTAKVFEKIKYGLHFLLSRKEPRPARKEKRLQLMTTNQTVTKVPIWKKQLTRLADPLLKILQSNGTKSLAKNPTTYIVIGLLVISVVGFNTVRANKAEQAQALADAEATVATVTNNLNKIDSHLIVGRDGDAIALVQESRDILNSLGGIVEVEEDVKNLESELEERSRRLRKEIVISEPVITAGNFTELLGNPANNLLRDEKAAIFIISANPRKALRLEAENEPEVIEITTDLNTFNEAAVISGDEIALIDKNVIAVINTNSLESSSSVANRQAQLTGAAVFNNRLYTLSPAENQILRSNRAPGFSVFQDWLSDEGADVSNARDLAIDGSIFVLKPDGIVELLRNRLANPGINLDPVEPAMRDAQKIWTDSESQRLYVLEADRLMVFEKTGKFIAQYKVENRTDFIDMLIDEENKAAFLLTPDELIQIEIE